MLNIACLGIPVVPLGVELGLLMKAGPGTRSSHSPAGPLRKHLPKQPWLPCPLCQGGARTSSLTKDPHDSPTRWVLLLPHSPDEAQEYKSLPRKWRTRVSTAVCRRHHILPLTIVTRASWAPRGCDTLSPGREVTQEGLEVKGHADGWSTRILQR